MLFLNFLANIGDSTSEPFNSGLNISSEVFLALILIIIAVIGFMIAYIISLNNRISVIEKKKEKK